MTPAALTLLTTSLALACVGTLWWLPAFLAFAVVAVVREVRRG